MRKTHKTTEFDLGNFFSVYGLKNVSELTKKFAHCHEFRTVDIVQVVYGTNCTKAN